MPTVLPTRHLSLVTLFANERQTTGRIHEVALDVVDHWRFIYMFFLSTLN